MVNIISCENEWYELPPPRLCLEIEYPPLPTSLATGRSSPMSYVGKWWCEKKNQGSFHPHARKFDAEHAFFAAGYTKPANGHKSHGFCKARPPLPPPHLLYSGQGGGSRTHGVTIDNYLTTLPLKKGLSSSAAVCVLVVRAFCLAYGLELSVPQVCATWQLSFLPFGRHCCCIVFGRYITACFT